MHKRTFTAFAVLMASTAMTVLPSAAQAALQGNLGFVRPLTDWRIGEIVSSADGVQGYCASVNKFEQGLTLALAKAKNGNFSFAIDFPDKAFKKGQKVPVTLQHSQGYQLQTTAIAATSRSLIVQLGQEDLMFSAMTGEGHLNVALPEVDMKVSLATFEKSARKLIDCVDSLAVEPIEIQEVRAVPPKFESNAESQVLAKLVPMPSESPAPLNVSKVQQEVEAPEIVVAEAVEVQQLENLVPMAGETAVVTEVKAETQADMQVESEVETELSQPSEDILRNQRLNALMAVTETVEPVVPKAPEVAEVTAEQSAAVSIQKEEIKWVENTNTEMTTSVVEVPEVEAPEIAEQQSPVLNEAVVETEMSVTEVDVPAAKPADIQPPVIQAEHAVSMDVNVSDKIAELETAQKSLVAARKSMEISGQSAETKALLDTRIEHHTNELAKLKGMPAQRPAIMPIQAQAVAIQPVVPIQPNTAVAPKPSVQADVPVEQNDSNDSDSIVKLLEQYEPRAGGNMMAVQKAPVIKSTEVFVQDQPVMKHENVTAPVSLTAKIQGMADVSKPEWHNILSSSGLGNVNMKPAVERQGRGMQQIWTGDYQGQFIKGALSRYDQLSARNFDVHAAAFLKSYTETQCKDILSSNGLNIISDKLAASDIVCRTSADAAPKVVSMVFFVDQGDKFSVMHLENEGGQGSLLQNINGALIQHISSVIHGSELQKDIELDRNAPEKSVENI